MEETLTEKQQYFRQYYQDNKDKYRAKANAYYHICHKSLNGFHVQQQSGFSFWSFASCFNILRASAEGFGGGGFMPKQHSYNNVYSHPNIYHTGRKY